jgi:hypothetical protein
MSQENVESSAYRQRLRCREQPRRGLDERIATRFPAIATSLTARVSRQLGAVLDRHLAEVAVDVQGDRSHLASFDCVEETQRAKRHRRIRARSTTGQVAGAAIE